MTKKVVDLITYKIDKALRENGFELKKDGEKKVKLLIKLNTEDQFTDNF
jgi:hypothetical protein